MTTNSVDLWEVITESPTGLKPFGQTFHEQETASAYAREMRRAGYSADLSPVFGTMPTAAEAMALAATFYDDAALQWRSTHKEADR